MRLLPLAVLVFLSAGAMYAVMTSGGYRNGRFWVSLRGFAKNAYVYGIMEGDHRGRFTGAMDALGLSDPKRAVKKADESQAESVWMVMSASSVSNDEVTEHLDVFYAEVANRNIPIIDAIHVLVMKLEGRTTANIDEFVASLRTRSKPDKDE